VLSLDLDFLELGQRPQPKVQDGLGLHLREPKPSNELRLRLILETDDPDHLIDVEIGDQVTVEDFEPVLDSPQPELRAPDQHLLAVIQPLPQHIPQRQHVRDLAVRQHVHVEAKADLELGKPEQALHHQHGINGPALGLDNESHLLCGLIAYIAHQRQLTLLQQVGDRLHELGLRYLVGNFRDHDLVSAATSILAMPFRAQAEAAATRLIGLYDRFPGLDKHAAGREIRPRNELDQLLDRSVGVLDKVQERVAQLLYVVRRNIGRHPDRNAR